MRGHALGKSGIQFWGVVDGIYCRKNIIGIMISTPPEIWTCLDPDLLQDLECCSIDSSAPTAGHPKDFHSNLGMQVGAPTLEVIDLNHPYPLGVLGVLAWAFLLGLQVET